MKTITLLAAAFLTIALHAQDRQIEFRHLTFDEALAASADENKPIFMDCYTVWCGPCKWMSANIFTQNEVADYYNENFICVKFDMEKGEGINIAKEFSIRAYPTLIFVNSKRQLVMKSVGASRENAHYIELGNQAKSDQYNLVALAKNVANNRSDAAYMSKYFKIMSGADMVDQKEVGIYFAGIPKDEWSSKANFEIMMSVVEDIEGDVFQDVIKNGEKYRKENGETADQFVSYKVQNALMGKLYSREPEAEAAYKALLAKVETWNFKGKGNVVFSVESARQKRKSPEAYMEYCASKVETFVWDDANELNNIAWFFFENTDDAEYLGKAEKWAGRAVALNPQHHVLDTYGNLLYANKKYEKALEVETEALNKAKEEGADTSSYQEVIAQIKAAL